MIATCLEATGLSPSLLDTAATPEIKAELRAATEQAQRLGLFGAPSFTIGDELFWGDDRLRAALRTASIGL